jgi:hypothetical protein
MLLAEMAKTRDLVSVHKSGKFSGLSCTSVPANSNFASRIQEMAESRDFDAIKVYQAEHFYWAALSKR